MKKLKNVYDNEKFFQGYMAIREGENNHNDLIEQPAIMSIMPSVKGKRVLDLGCGYGQNSFDFAKNGAEYVLGIDLSEKMLDKAKRENNHPCVDYLRMDMEKIHTINKKFDVVYSSLAFHYVKDFKKLINDIYKLLDDGGELIFSQEHPITTATVDGKGDFNKSEDGRYLSYTFSNYNEDGERIVTWFVDGLTKYHRSFSTILSTIIDTGFKITGILEPKPDEKTIEAVPRMVKELIKPSFLIIKAQKTYCVK